MDNPLIAGIIQARLGSSRFPGNIKTSGLKTVALT
jgi:spore coat polysaccharide biosynthesis protein SpsF (cytidylyltransferase family)